MQLVRRLVGNWSLNAYALICPVTLHSVLVDPGAEPDTLKKMLEGTQPKAILVTHSHPDHIGALVEMKKHFNIPVKAHPGRDGFNSPVRADRWLTHGDSVSVGHQILSVHHAPGHTLDQICLDVQSNPIIIVGDTLFEGGPGKTWSPQGFRQTLKTLKHVVLKWPDESICYPGHGSHFRLGHKRAEIERFLRKHHGDFYGDAHWGM